MKIRFSESRDFPCGWTDRWTDMTAFHNFAKSPNTKHSNSTYENILEGVSGVPSQKPHVSLLEDITLLFLHVPTEQPKTFRPEKKIKLTLEHATKAEIPV